MNVDNAVPEVDEQDDDSDSREGTDGGQDDSSDDGDSDEGCGAFEEFPLGPAPTPPAGPQNGGRGGMPPNPGPNPPQGPPGNRMIGARARRGLYWCTHHLHFGTSREQAMRHGDLAEVITGSRADLQFSKDVEPILERFASNFDLRKYYFCPAPACCRELRSISSSCQNQFCSLYLVERKRSKEVTAGEVILVDTAPQLLELLRERKAEIVQFHQSLHAQQAQGLNNSRRCDTRFYPGYYKSIETAAAFARKTVVINLSLASDGFTPKRLTKSEGWPLYLRMECLPRRDKDDYFNTILSGILYTKKSPPEVLLKNLCSRVKEELDDLARNPPVMSVNGVDWTFRFKIQYGVLDLAGQKDLFGLPRWTSECGCSKCDMPGTRVGGKRIWCSPFPTRFRRRTRNSILADGVTGSNGVPGITSFMELLTPDQCPADWLHIVSEGVTKNRLRDMSSTKTQFPGLRLVPDDYKKLCSSLRAVQNYTYSPKFILGLEDLTKCTGSEIDALCNVVFPLAASRGLCPDSLAAGTLVAYWVILRVLMDVEQLTVERLEAVRSLAFKLDYLWIKMASVIYTMKLHLLLHHALSDELLLIGSPYQWTSGGFESIHKRLQVVIDQHTTNSHALLVERFLLTKTVIRRFEAECLLHRDPKYLDLLQKVKNLHVVRNPVSDVITADVYVPQKSRIEDGRIQPDHMDILRNRLPPGSIVSSRLVVDTRVYASKMYWRSDELTTQMHLVRYKVGPNFKFGSIVLFAAFPLVHKVVMIVEEYDTKCPFEDLSDVIHGNRTARLQRPTTRLLADACRLNDYFYQVTGAMSDLPESILQSWNDMTPEMRKAILDIAEKDRVRNLLTERQDNAVNHLLGNMVVQPPPPTPSPTLLDVDADIQADHEVEHRASEDDAFRRNAFSLKQENRAKEVLRISTPLDKIKKSIRGSSAADIYIIGKLIHQGLEAGTLSQSELDGFMKSNLAEQLRSIDNSGLYGAIDGLDTSSSPVDDLQNILRFHAAGSKFVMDMSLLKSDITSASVANLAMRVDEECGSDSSGHEVAVSLVNLKTAWNLEANNFKTCSVNKLMDGWTPLRDPRLAKQVTHVLRHCGKIIAQPVEKIMQYTHTPGCAPKGALLEIPTEVVRVLKGFTLELIGLGHQEVTDVTMTYETVTSNNSLFWQSLEGEEDAEKWKQLCALRSVAETWRQLSFHTALQNAMIDIRRGVYRRQPNGEMKWESNRKRPKNVNDEAENTEVGTSATKKSSRG